MRRRKRLLEDDTDYGGRVLRTRPIRVDAPVKENTAIRDVGKQLLDYKMKQEEIARESADKEADRAYKKEMKLLDFDMNKPYKDAALKANEQSVNESQNRIKESKRKTKVQAAAEELLAARLAAGDDFDGQAAFDEITAKYNIPEGSRGSVLEKLNKHMEKTADSMLKQREAEEKEAKENAKAKIKDLTKTAAKYKEEEEEYDKKRAFAQRGFDSDGSLIEDSDAGSAEEIKRKLVEYYNLQKAMARRKRAKVVEQINSINGQGAEKEQPAQEQPVAEAPAQPTQYPPRTPENIQRAREILAKKRGMQQVQQPAQPQVQQPTAPQTDMPADHQRRINEINARQMQIERELAPLATMDIKEIRTKDDLQIIKEKDRLMKEMEALEKERAFIIGDAKRAVQMQKQWS